MFEINKRNIRTWSMLGTRGTFGACMLGLAKNDPNLLCLTSDLCATSGLEHFRIEYPEQLINVGIAEQNMLGIAAGLSMDGYRVFASTFATFASMRALEQLRTGLAYMNLNVKVVGLASGFSMAFFGNTHYAIEDLAITRAIPNLLVVSPADGLETIKVLSALAEYEGPAYVRLTGQANCPVIYSEDYEFQLGKGVVLKEGRDIALIATGTIVSEALKAAEQLEQQGICCTVVDMHTVKPLDTELLDELLSVHKMIVTVEEHSIIGGLGSAVAEFLTSQNKLPQHIILGISDTFTHPGTYPYLLQRHGLTADQIFQKIQNKVLSLEA